jgi:hypothetical protein
MRMGLSELLLGDGKLPDSVRAAIEEEGALFVEQGLRATMTSRGFRSPGRMWFYEMSFDAKPLMVALGLSEKRLVVFARSGKSKLVDVPFANPDRAALAASFGSGKVMLDAEDRFGALRTGGKIRIRISTPNAAAIVQALSVRLGNATAPPG